MVKLFHDVFKLTLEGKNFVITKLFTHSDDCLPIQARRLFGFGVILWSPRCFPVKHDFLALF